MIIVGTGTIIGEKRKPQDKNMNKFIKGLIFALGIILSCGAAKGIAVMMTQPLKDDLVVKKNFEMIVSSSSQDSEGITQDNLNMVFLNNFEAYQVERIKENAKKNLKPKIGKMPEIKSNSNYFEKDGKKLAIIRIETFLENKRGYIVVVLGIKRNELKRVMCIHDNEISITTGKCSEQIEKTFGIKLKA